MEAQILAIIEAYLAPLIQKELTALIAEGEAHLPAVAKLLVQEVLSLPWVQDEIKQLSNGKLDQLLHWLWHEASDFGARVAAYVKQRIAHVQILPAEAGVDALGRVSLDAMRKIAAMKTSDIDKALGVAAA